MDRACCLYPAPARRQLGRVLHRTANGLSLATGLSLASSGGNGPADSAIRADARVPPASTHGTADANGPAGCAIRADARVPPASTHGTADANGPAGCAIRADARVPPAAARLWPAAARIWPAAARLRLRSAYGRCAAYGSADHSARHSCLAAGHQCARPCARAPVCHHRTSLQTGLMSMHYGLRSNLARRSEI
jgi:hypothetical protein